MKPLLSIALAALLFASAGPASAIDLAATTEEPRAFGHQVGDVVTRVVWIDVPAGLTLDADSLPTPGRLSAALDLRALSRGDEGIAGGTRVRLELVFQVFAAPVAPRIVDLPTLKLRFDGGGGRSQELRVDPWPLAVSPLGPEAASPRHGLGELRPDQPPPAADTRMLRAVVVVGTTLAALIGVWLAAVYFGLPWWSRRHRPFGLAWRELQAARRRGALGEEAAACATITRRLHAALNASAGHVLFAEGVEAFVAAAPRYAPLRADLLSFFERSRGAFFAAAPADDPHWLLDLARALRDAERGTA
jgi:mxaA protein